MAATQLRKYTRAEIRRNRIIVAAGFALIVGLIVLIVVLVSPAKPPKGFAQQGPVAAQPDTTYLTGRDLYDFNAPVPESSRVDSAYFEDALFIGESHIGGLVLINETFPGATVLYSNSASIGGGLSAAYKLGGTQESPVLSEFLESHSYSKIYIQFGLNELGWRYKEQFANSYKSFIQQLLPLCKDAQIYLCSIIPVSEVQSQASADYNNTNIDYYNQFIQRTAAELELFYLDIGTAYKEGIGVLRADCTDNGINIKYNCYDIWYEYTCTHVPPEYVM